MSKSLATVPAFVAILACAAQVSALQPAQSADSDVASGATPVRNVLGPPIADGPVVVRSRLDLHDINVIDDEAETFDFTAVMTLTWRDPRQAFDPAAEGVQEKIYQGDYQFNELSPAWYPQVVMINQAGAYEKSGVVLRVLPDGTSILVETIHAVAESVLDMRRYPFDAHRLEAVFEVLGFDRDEVVLQADQQGDTPRDRSAAIPQWSISRINLKAQDRAASYAGARNASSALVLEVDVQRRPFYVVRLVGIPLAIIVLLSFAVFWMDRSSLGDRINVSFIGILTGVAYQNLVSDNLPRISYVTLMHGFLNLSFLTMCATVVINLAVGSMDKRGKFEVGDRIDRRCRWAFPLVYFGLLAVMVWVTFRYF